MKKTCIAIIILSCFLGVLKAQTIEFSDSLFQAENYKLSLDAYESLLAKKPKDITYNFRAGVSAFKLKQYESAKDYFLQSSSKIPLSNFYLGEINFQDYYFDDAIDYYEDFLLDADSLLNINEIKTANNKLKKAKLGSRFLNRVENVQIIDSLVVKKSDLINNIQIPSELGTIKQNALLYQNKLLDQMSYTTERGDRSYFSELRDDNFDLFTAYKLLDKWNEKTSINDLNSQANENYPFLMLDGITLYFASDGENSMGGYDIFMTRMNPADNHFFPPENIGMPFNSPYNDYMMIIDELNQVGWFVSDRYQPEDKVAIYQFIPNLEKEIIKIDNIDSLISIAQIKNISHLDKNAVINNNEQKRINPNIEQTRIHITEKIIYSDASDFQSNNARNHYYQLTKLKDEYHNIKNELKELRLVYASSDETKKKDAITTILSLEKKLKELNQLISEKEILMRNEEIKTIKK